MSDTNHLSDRLREPLNETTRKVRRNLMAASVIGVVLTKVGLVPSKITAFGVEFTSANQQALMTLLAAAIGYFAISFLVYVYSELTAWQIVLTSKELEEFKEASITSSQGIFGNDENKKFRKHIEYIHFKSKPTFYLRLIVELLIPLIFAFYSGVALVNMDTSKSVNTKPAVQEPANEKKNKDT